MHDAQFFSHLIRERNLPSFTISSCGHAADAGGDGITFLADALNELPSIPGFENVEAILIVADNDANPKDAFSGVVEKINATAEIIGPPKRRYIAPDAPLKKAGSNPAIVVMMLPWTNCNGALDTLCYASAARKRPDIGMCVESFAKCAKSDIWAITKMSKMKLRSLLSAAHHVDPYIAPAWVWSDGTDLIPLDDVAFNDIDKFLRKFHEVIA